MASQTLGYIFPFSRFSFPTDLSCIVLSEGRKSTFFKVCFYNRFSDTHSLRFTFSQTDITVPLQPKFSTAEEISKLYKPSQGISSPPAEKLAAFRDLIIGARQGKVRVSETTSEVRVPLS